MEGAAPALGVGAPAAGQEANAASTWPCTSPRGTVTVVVAPPQTARKSATPGPQTARTAVAPTPPPKVKAIAKSPSVLGEGAHEEYSYSYQVAAAAKVVRVRNLAVPAGGAAVGPPTTSAIQPVAAPALRAHTAAEAAYVRLYAARLAIQVASKLPLSVMGSCMRCLLLGISFMTLVSRAANVAAALARARASCHACRPRGLVALAR